MGTSRTGAAGAASRIQVSRTGKAAPATRTGRQAPPFVSPILPSTRSSSGIASRPWRSCRPRASTSSSPTRPTISSSRRSDAPRPEPRRCRRRRLGQVRELLRLRRLHARMAPGLPPGHEDERDALGDRLLSQHLPGRRHLAGPRLLDPQRRGVAQGQPDAELPRPALHQCPRDPDLGRERRGRQGLHLPLRGAEGRQRRPADALRTGSSRSAPARSA